MYEWNEENTQLITKLWNVDGLTASEIAAAMKISRSAVIGKANRLGLESRKERVFLTPHQREAMAQEHNRRRRERRKQARMLAGRPEPGIRVHRNPPKLIAVVSEENSLKLSLFDLTNDTCHWPTNDDMQNAEFCGHPVAAGPGHPYCSHHRWRSAPRSEMVCDAPEVPTPTHKTDGFNFWKTQVG